MKIKLLLVFTLFLFAVSCTIEKRHYRPGYSLEFNSSYTRQATQQHPAALKIKSLLPADLQVQPPSADLRYELASREGAPFISPFHSQKKVGIENDLPDRCDVIVLKNRDKINAIVLQMTAEEIKYKRCDGSNLPDTAVSKSSVWLIQYADGHRDVINPELSGQDSVYSTVDTANAKVHPLAVIAFFLSISIFFGFIWGPLFGLLFGFISRHQIKKYPAKYKGRGWAVAAIILGFVAIFIIILAVIAFSNANWGLGIQL